MKTVFDIVQNQSLLTTEMAQPFAPGDPDSYSNADGNCGLPPIKPLRSRSKVPDKWKEYDRKKAAYDQCRSGKKEDRNDKKEDRKDKRDDRKDDRKEKKEQGKGVGNGIKRFNPLSTAARAGVLAAFRVNMFGLATRIYPAFLSTDEVKRRKFKAGNAANAKKSWSNLATFWEKKMGGKASNLEQAIKQGYNKPIFETKKHKELVQSHSFAGIGAGGGFWDYLAGNYPDVTLSSVTGEEAEFIDNFSMFMGKYNPEHKSNTTGCAPGWWQDYYGLCHKNNKSQNQAGARTGRPLKTTFFKYKNGTGGSTGSSVWDSRAQVNSGVDGVTAKVNSDYEFYYGVIDPGTATVIVAGMPVVVFIASKIMSGLNKDPYETGGDMGYSDDLGDSEKSGDMDMPDLDDEALNDITAQGEDDAANGGDDDSKIWGMPKPVFYGGLILMIGLTAWGVYKFVIKKGA